MQNERHRSDIRQFRALRGFIAPRLRSVTRYGDRPASNILRGLLVCVTAMSALLAVEVQTPSVRRRDKAALMARAAGVVRTYRFGCHTFSRSLVRDLESHIGIRPSADFGAQVLALTDRTVSDVRQVLYHDLTGSDANAVADQCLGGSMQEMLRYGSFVSRHPFQESPGASSANGLNDGAGASYTRTAMVKFASVVEEWFGGAGIGGDKKALYAHVHTNDTALGFRFWDVYFITENKVPLFTYQLEFGVFPSRFWQWSGISDSQNLTPESKPFAGAVKVSVPHQRDYRLFELSLVPCSFGLHSVIGRTHGFRRGTCELRWKAEFTQLCITSFMYAIGIGILGFEDNIRKPIRAFNPHRHQHLSFCGSVDSDFHGSDCLHWGAQYMTAQRLSTTKTNKEIVPHKGGGIEIKL